MFAAMDCDDQRAHFYRIAPECRAIAFVSNGNYVTARLVHASHPDWRNSLITREEFESVDGWVRHIMDGVPEINDGSSIDVKYCDDLLAFGILLESVNDDDSLDSWGNVRKWRYHKPQKQEVKPEPESIETMIRRYKAAGENKRAAIDNLSKAQADVEQAEALEDSLFMAIEAWAESHGFDIRVLSEGEERVSGNDGKFHNHNHQSPTEDDYGSISLNEICDGCGKRFGVHYVLNCERVK
ncbi:MAG: hypothetical protein ACRCYD_01850 [Plesiomonas sp.]